MPANKDNCRKADLYIYTGERNKYLVVGNRFFDWVTIARNGFKYISNE